MTPLPLDQAAEAVLGAATTGEEPVTVAVAPLMTALAARPEGFVGALAGALGDALGNALRNLPAEIAAASLIEAADREAERAGWDAIRCEYLLLGLLRMADGRDGPGVVAGRARFQEMKADWAHSAWAKLRRDEARDLAGEHSEHRSLLVPTPPAAILIAGIPGTGKSTLAETLARELRAPLLSLDWYLGALAPFGIQQETAMPLEETLLTASIARQLRLGLSVVIDHPGHLRRARDHWREVTENLGAAFIGIECVCSDAEVHRSRVDGRTRDVPNWPSTVSWAHVERMRELWESWEEQHLTIDSARVAPDDALHTVLRAVRAA